MFGLIRRAFMSTPEERAILRDDRKRQLSEYRDAEAAKRRDEETCNYCRGSRMCHFCGGARSNSQHELGSECHYCRDGRCSCCSR